MTEASNQTAESLPENPTIDATTLFNAALKADQEGIWGNDGAQQDADTARIVETSVEVPSGDRAPAASGTEEQVRDKAEPSAEKQAAQDTGPPRDEKGRFKAREGDEPTQAQQPQSAYAQAKDKDRETERQKHLLANFEEDKRRAREQLEAERQQLARERAQIERFRAVPRQADGRPYEFSAKQYAKAAEDFYERGKKALAGGDPDEANKNFAMAEQSSQAAEQVYRAEQDQQQQAAVNQHWQWWQQNMEAAIQKNPELADGNSPLAQEVNKLLENEPLLEQIPNGFGVAAYIAEKTIQAAKASALSEENEKLKAENHDLRGRLGIRPAPSAGALPAARTFDTMSDKEQAAFLRQRSAEEDRIPAY